MKQNKLYSFLILVGMLAICSCAKENEALVNPPLITETVQIRFLNLSGDETPKTLALERQTRYENIPFQFVSNAQNPPFDSVIIQVFAGNNLEYAREQRQRFSRRTNCIFVALPSKSDKPEPKSVDTVFIIQTTILQPEDTNQCYIKFLNANPDARVTYSVKLGCPNGENVFKNSQITNFTYCQASGTQEIYEGKRVISIIKNIAGSGDNPAGTELVGIFELDLKRLGQYILIVNKYDDVFFIDELVTASIALQPMQSIDERNAYVRVVNLSSESVTVAMSPGNVLASNLNTNSISQYNTISTCDATSLDKIILEHNGATTDSLYISFDVYKNYSIFAFDKMDAKASKIIAISPIDDRMIKKPDSAIIRVVNGNYENSGLTVSLGARESRDPNNKFGYSSGELLTVNLFEGEVSNAMYIQSGSNVPISVFTTTQPTKYLFSSNVAIEAGKEYVIAIDYSDGEGRLVAIEQGAESHSFSYALQSAFLQFANVVAGANQMTFSIPNLISDGRLAFNNTMTTFVPLGSNSITINGKTHNFTATRANRILLIASNTASNTDIFDIQSPNLGATAYNLKHRFINASFDTPFLQVNTDSETVINDNISYQSASAIREQWRERKYTFFFRNQTTDVELLRVGDLPLSFNKNYSIIFYGNKSSGYGITHLQEY